MLPRRIGLAITAAVSIVAHGGDNARACPALKSADSPRTVAEIVDADTIRLDDGSEVRLIGALAPKRPLTFVSRSPWKPEQEAVAALRELALGKTAEIIDAGRPADRYARRLAHVAVIDSNGDRLWLQGALLERGLARTYVLPGSTDCLSEMLSREQNARARRAGLWAFGAYAVRRATRPSELMKMRSTFQIVEGRVVSVATIRGSVYLNFGSDWRRDFTAALLKPGRARDGKPSQPDLAVLKGRTVRVRGWIERRNGPFVEIVDANEIEVVERPAEVAKSDAESSNGIATVGDENEKRPASLPGVSEP